MAETIEKLEQKIKALQAKKREATKKEKEKIFKAEMARLKEVEKEYILLQEQVKKNEPKLNNYDAIMEQAKMLGFTAKTLYEWLQQEASKKSQEQNN